VQRNAEFWRETEISAMIDGGIRMCYLCFIYTLVFTISLALAECEQSCGSCICYIFCIFHRVQAPSESSPLIIQRLAMYFPHFSKHMVISLQISGLGISTACNISFVSGCLYSTCGNTITLHCITGNTQVIEAHLGRWSRLCWYDRRLDVLVRVSIIRVPKSLGALL